MLKKMQDLGRVSVLSKAAQKQVRGGKVEYKCTCSGTNNWWIMDYGAGGPTQAQVAASIELWCGAGHPATCFWSVVGNPGHPAF
jgi:hypothetical protein